MDIKKEVELLKDPLRIPEAAYASSAKVLTFVFDRDPRVLSLIRAGHKVVPFVEAEIKQNGTKLNDITLSCYAYILQKVDPKEAAEYLIHLYPKVIEERKFFASTFFTHAVRVGLRLPLEEHNFYYRPSAVQETLEAARLRRRV